MATICEFGVPIGGAVVAAVERLPTLHEKNGGIAASRGNALSWLPVMRPD